MEPSANVRRPRVYRTRAQTLGIAVCLVWAMGFALLAIFSTQRHGHVAWSIGAAVGVAGLWRAWAGGVHVGADGIKVVGSVWSKRFAWSQVERFAVLPAGQYDAIGHVFIKGHHEPLVILALGGKEAQGPVDQLNELLGQWRSSHPEPGAPADSTAPA